MNSVLITGADGFLGRHIVRDLTSRGFNVLAKRRADGDVSQSSTWQTFPAANYLIHLAGSTFVPASWEEPSAFVQANSISTSYALDFCRSNNARMIFLSTYLYAANANLPIKETDAIDPANPYALSKLFGEQLCSFYAKHFGVELVILRPFNVYGAGQSPRFLVPSIISQAKKGDEIRVLDSRPARDYLFIEDLLEAVNLSLTSKLKFGIFNIGTGVASSVEDLIQTLGQVIGRELKVVSAEQERFGEINSTQASILQATNILGWKPKWTLADGLADLWKATDQENFR